MRLGGIENIKVDVRIIAATNVDLQKMMQEGRFREDLYYRLHVITVQLPALRERKDDIPLLVQHFLDKYGVENNKPGLELSAEALDLLIDYDWPGNVRELENVIERATVLTSGPADRRGPRAGQRAQQPQLPDAAVRGAARGDLLPRRRGVVPARADRVGARGRRRRAEARRGAAAHQADDAERDDQAARHPAAAEEGAERIRRRRVPATTPTPTASTKPSRRTGLTACESPSSGATGVVGDAIVREGLRDRRIDVDPRRQPPPAAAHAIPSSRPRSSATSATSRRSSPRSATVDFVLCALGHLVVPGERRGAVPARSRTTT